MALTYEHIAHGHEGSLSISYRRSQPLLPVSASVDDIMSIQHSYPGAQSAVCIGVFSEIP
jgi:hypothetical protein